MPLYSLFRPLAFALDPERAHRMTIAGLKAAPIGAPPASPGRLAVRVAGLDFPNPVGLAAGFDKDGEVPAKMLGLGFGFVEIGTLTPQPQPGNPRPRIFRLAEDEAVINRLGFNNGGQAAARERLEKRARSQGILGINIGANKDSVGSGKALSDYIRGVQAMGPIADYLTVNISSPNTPGLRALQDEAALAELLEAAIAARDALADARPPLFLKVAPDLEPADIDAIARIAADKAVDALVVGNTTISRPPLRSRFATEAGGLSGRPLAALARQRLADFRSATGGAIPLIAVGGIDTAEEAWARIRAGASLVQLYTGLIYRGPGLGRGIVKGLDRLMRREGFDSLAEAVGGE